MKSRAGVGAWLALAITAAGCSGAAQHSQETLTRLHKYDITRTPPGATQIASGTDAGSNSSITGKQPTLQVVFSTAQPIEQAVDYYRTQFPSYRLTPLAPNPPGGVRYFGGLGLDSVSVSVTRDRPALEDRPRLKVSAQVGLTYITIFEIAGG